MFERKYQFRYFSMILLFCVLLISLVEVYSNQVIRIKGILMYEGLSILKGFAFMDIKLPTHLQCAKLCYSYKHCDSLKFDSTTKICSLNLISTKETGWYFPHPNALFINRVNIPKELAGACMDHNCDLNSQCVENAGGASCVTMFRGEECDIPAPLPYLTPLAPLPILPGEIAMFSCISPLYGIVNVLCNVHGYWSIPILLGCKPDFCDTVHLIEPNYMSGVKKIRLVIQDDSLYSRVYCEAETDGGDWLVILRRRNMTFDFNRNENNYSTGFGDNEKDFWIGTNMLMVLTSVADVELRIEFKVTGNTIMHYAKYNRFHVGAENTTFSLTIGNYSEGNCGDGLSYLNSFGFNVTENGWGGWWNDEYCAGTNLNANKGSNMLKWSDGCDDNIATSVMNISYTQMMIRRKARK